MSSLRQTVIRGLSFTGCGNRPSLTPAHQVDLLTGIGPSGARIARNRRNALGGAGCCPSMTMVLRFG